MEVLNVEHWPVLPVGPVQSRCAAACCARAASAALPPRPQAAAPGLRRPRPRMSPADAPARGPPLAPLPLEAAGLVSDAPLIPVMTVAGLRRVLARLQDAAAAAYHPHLGRISALGAADSGFVASSSTTYASPTTNTTTSGCSSTGQSRSAHTLSSSFASLLSRHIPYYPRQTEQKQYSKYTINDAEREQQTVLVRGASFDAVSSLVVTDVVLDVGAPDARELSPLGGGCLRGAGAARAALAAAVRGAADRLAVFPQLLHQQYPQALQTHTSMRCAAPPPVMESGLSPERNRAALSCAGKQASPTAVVSLAAAGTTTTVAAVAVATTLAIAAACGGGVLPSLTFPGL